jgi:L-arabinose isomerase
MQRLVLTAVCARLVALIAPDGTAILASLGGERFRLLVSEGEVLDTAEFPNLEMPYRHHQVLNPGCHADTWRTFCELAGLEFAVA